MGKSKCNSTLQLRNPQGCTRKPRYSSPKEENFHKISNSIAGALEVHPRSNMESERIHWEGVIRDIKQAKKHVYPLLLVKQIFNDKIEGQSIPEEYVQELVDEIGKCGACTLVLNNPNLFKSAKIENCICETIKQGYCILGYVIEKIANRKSFDHVKFLEGMLAINADATEYKSNIDRTLRSYLHKVIDGYFYEQINEKDSKFITNIILESEYCRNLLGSLGPDFKRAFQPT